MKRQTTMKDGTTNPHDGDTLVNPSKTACGVGIVAGNAGSKVANISPVPAYRNVKHGLEIKVVITNREKHERPTDCMEHCSALETTDLATEIMSGVI